MAISRKIQHDMNQVLISNQSNVKQSSINNRCYSYL